jgi:hypothetical protein
VRILPRFNERLPEAILGIEALATTTKPEDKQEVFEPKSSGPLRELADLFRLHRIGAAPVFRSTPSGAMIRLKFL